MITPALLFPAERPDTPEQPALFETPPPPPPTVPLTRSMSARQQHHARHGRHPMGHFMPEEGHPACGHTCKDCGHLQRNEWGRTTYLKCGLVRLQTKGPGTDTRATWPACARWTPQAETP